ALPGVSREVNRRFVGLFAGSHYRTFDNEPRDSPWAAIAQLPAAHAARIRGGDISSSPYWTLEDKPDLDGSVPALAERYRALLLDAVARRLRVAERPAFTLSGGMDSSSVLACAVAAAGGRRQHAFSTVYVDATYDESAEIQSMLASTVETWHPVRVGNPDLLATVRRMIEANDEPVATATWLSHYVLCEEVARAGFGTLFGGLGGDELNGGAYA